MQHSTIQGICHWPKIIALFFIVVSVGCYSTKQVTRTQKILVFSATKGFRHNSIEAGKAALLKMGSEKSWNMDTTEDARVFTEANLKQYGAVLFLNTTGNVLDDEQQVAFQKYIQAGGGFVGIHAATDTEYDWPWYNNLVGAYFESHPRPQTGLYNIVNKDHPSVDFMPDTLRRMEEIYNFKSFKKELVNVLITIDEKSYTGGKMPGYHPIAWYHNYDGGRAFYTEWGHHPETFTDPLFLQHISGAIKWALLK
jgi:type 1 glutamine amidotransferase